MPAIRVTWFTERGGSLQYSYSDHWYPVKEHFYPDGVFTSSMALSPFTGLKGSLIGLISMVNNILWCSQPYDLNTVGHLWEIFY